MLGGVAFFGGLIGITGGIVWTLFNQRRIWVGKWKSKSVIITVEGRTIRLMIDKKEVFVGKAWNKEGVFELQFQDEEQGECSGVLLVQHVPNGETRTFLAELIIDGESKKTIHPLIYYANESFINFEDLQEKICSLKKSCIEGDEKKAFIIIKELVPEWKAKNNN